MILLHKHFSFSEENKLTYSVLLWTVISIDFRRTFHPPKGANKHDLMLLVKANRKADGEKRMYSTYSMPQLQVIYFIEIINLMAKIYTK